VWSIPRFIRRLRAELPGLGLQLSDLLARLTDLPNPGSLTISVISEERGMLQFKITLPTLPPEPNDIVSGELTVKVGDAESAVVTTAKDQLEVVGLEGEQNAALSVSFAYIDDAGNRSVHPSTISDSLRDTIPPADPGALGLVITGET